jgi:hypothetical protein
MKTEAKSLHGNADQMPPELRAPSGPPGGEDPMQLITGSDNGIEYKQDSYRTQLVHFTLAKYPSSAHSRVAVLKYRG